jgi:signal transduction histidine kinase
LQHTPAGGTITLRAETTPRALTLTVADDGSGISPEHLPHIFDRFYRADRARTRSAPATTGARHPGAGGSGLGLAISAAIVEAHGGTVTAESPGEGQGSTFTIRLPR